MEVTTQGKIRTSKACPRPDHHASWLAVRVSLRPVWRCAAKASWTPAGSMRTSSMARGRRSLLPAAREARPVVVVALAAWSATMSVPRAADNERDERNSRRLTRRGTRNSFMGRLTWRAGRWRNTSPRLDTCRTAGAGPLPLPAAGPASAEAAGCWSAPCTARKSAGSVVRLPPDAPEGPRGSGQIASRFLPRRCGGHTACCARSRRLISRAFPSAMCS